MKRNGSEILFTRKENKCVFALFRISSYQSKPVKNANETMRTSKGKENARKNYRKAKWSKIIDFPEYSQKGQYLLQRIQPIWTSRREYSERYIDWTVTARVSFETSVDSKQPKLEQKPVSALSETERLFRLFRFYIETAGFDVSIKPKPKQAEHKG